MFAWDTERKRTHVFFRESTIAIGKKKTVGVNFIFNHTADVVQKSMMTVDIDVIYYRSYTGYWIRK